MRRRNPRRSSTGRQDRRAWTNQPGLKDTVLVPGMEEVEIIAYLDNPGQWMAHCHIFEHAKLDMLCG